MAVVHFYCKLGCQNNNKQKQLLTAAGHNILEYDIESVELTEATLRSFFGKKQVHDWFNPTAPSIKKGQIHPEKVGEQEALKAMIKDRLLIKRPLIQIGAERFCGFDSNKLKGLVGLNPIPGEEETIDTLLNDDLVTCPNINSTSCMEKEINNG